MKNPLIKTGMVVIVVGLGVTGISAVRYLYSCGARVRVSDTRDMDDMKPEEKTVLSEYCDMYEVGGHSERFLKDAEMVFVSPGVPQDSDMVLAAKRAGITLVGELALAAPMLPENVVAITGTNGKTTVTTLIGEMCRQAGQNVYVGGNIGYPVLDGLMARKVADTMVLEVSSFQLEKCGTFRAKVGVLLNITPDHLDRHGSLEEYAGAKGNLFLNQVAGDSAIVWKECVACCDVASSTGEGDVLFFGASEDCSAQITGDEIHYLQDDKLECYELKGTSFDNRTGRINCAAAILAARSCGCEPPPIMEAIKAFEPLRHRLEQVEIVDGVCYCNDSKATNTGAVISALLQLEGKIILIAGGKDKGDDYSLLRDAVGKKVKKAVLLGESAPLLGDTMEDVVAVEYVNTMEEAVQRAHDAAEPGDTVLLSPACASFDMFDSYGHRGDSFAESVRRLGSRIRRGRC